MQTAPRHPTLVPGAELRLLRGVDPDAQGTGMQRYRPGALLGEGGAAQVFAGADPSTGDEVVVKVMHHKLVARASLRRVFAFEATVPTLLGVPGVLPVLDHGEEADGRLWLVMPRVRGGQLDAHLRGPIVDLDHLRHRVGLIAQVAHTVGSAHARGFVHGDLKPSNVLVDHHDRAWVIDWGLARRDGRSVANFPAGTITGTLGWMAPEQARGEVHALSPETDVWALGCMLWCLLHGEPPGLHDDLVVAIRSAVRARRVGPPPADLPQAERGLWRIAAACLEPTVGARLACGTVVHDILQRWLRRTSAGGNRPAGTLREGRARTTPGTTLELSA